MTRPMVDPIAGVVMLSRAITVTSIEKLIGGSLNSDPLRG